MPVKTEADSTVRWAKHIRGPDWLTPFVRETALANLEAAREAGLAPRPQE